MGSSITTIRQIADGVEIGDKHEFVSFEDTGKAIFELQETTKKDIMHIIDNGSLWEQFSLFGNEDFMKLFKTRLNVDNQGQRRIRIGYLRASNESVSAAAQKCLARGIIWHKNIVEKFCNGSQ